MALATPIVEAMDSPEKEIFRAVRHSFVYGMGTVLGRAIGFLMLPFYTHFLSPQDYGVLEILDLSTTLLGMFLQMGITTAMLQYYGLAKTAGERRRVVSTAFLFAIAIASVTFVLAKLFAGRLSSAVLGPTIPSVYAFLSLISLALGCLWSVPLAYIQAKEASGTMVFLEAASLALTLGLNIYFIAARHMGVSGVLLGSVLSKVVGISVLAVWMIRKVGISFDWSVLKSLLVFGTPLIASGFAQFSLNYADRFFLQRFSSLDMVGVYSVGYKFALLINVLLVQPFALMWQPRMYVVHRRPDHERIFSNVLVLYSLILCFAAVGLSILSSEVIRVMVDARFYPSHKVIPLISLAYVFFGLTTFLRMGMFLANKTRLYSLLNFVIAVVNFVLNYVLISRYAMMGAAWATVLSFLLLAVACYGFSQRVFPLRLGARRIVKTIAVGVSLYAASTFLPARPWAIGAKVLLIASFPVLIWALRILSADERSSLNAIRVEALAALPLGWFRKRAFTS